MKLQTKVEYSKAGFQLTRDDKVMFLGSCFSQDMGEIADSHGFDVTINPFGPLYNPVSLSDAIVRMQENRPFEEDEVVKLGAGSQLYGSFSHYTKLARPSVEGFLEDANASLTVASAMWKSSSVVVLTLGTAFAYTHIKSGGIVANCLKRDASEFSRGLLSVKECTDALESFVGTVKDKTFIFQLCPVRILADGAHGNMLSKSTLALAVDEICRRHPDTCRYFPAYEIMMDELRDYRFYRDNMTHPTALAAGYIWELFSDWCIPSGERAWMEEMRKKKLASAHIPHVSHL